MAGRPKGSVKKTKEVKEKKEVKKLKCLYKSHEGGNPLAEINFYNSNSPLSVEGKATICKKCLKKLIDYDNIQSVYDVLRMLDLPFVYDCWVIAEECKTDTFGRYITMIQTLQQFKHYKTYNDSVFEPLKEINIKKAESARIKKQGMTDEEYIEKQLTYNQNKADAIRLLGYDPFEMDSEEDKYILYAKLTNMLSEDILEDGIKTDAIVSIIKGQNQENKINNLITSLSADSESLLNNIGTIKSLTDTREKLNKSNLLLAKDNKLSDLYSGNKTVGSNTLTGKLKKVRELDLDEAQVNLFDINTSLGMQQVAMLSTKAIVDNLNFGDDDLLDMVKFQRGKMQYYEQEYSKLREENRKLKTVCKYNNIDYKNMVFNEKWKDLKYDEEEKDMQQDKTKELENEIKKVKPLDIEEYSDELAKVKEENFKNKLKEDIIKEK